MVEKKYTIHPDKYGERFQYEIEQRLKAREQAKQPQFRPTENPEVLRTLIQKQRPVASLDHRGATSRLTDEHTPPEANQPGFYPFRFLGKLFSGLFKCGS